MFAAVDFTRVEFEVKTGIGQLKEIIFGDLRNLASNDLKSKIQSFEDAFISDCKLYDCQGNEDTELKEKKDLEIEVEQIQRDIENLEKELNFQEDHCSTTNTIHNSISTVDDEVNSFSGKKNLLESEKDESHDGDAKFYSCFDESFHFEDSESAFEVEEEKKEKTENVEKQVNQKNLSTFDLKNCMFNSQNKISQKAEVINNNQTNSFSHAETMDSEELEVENLFERCAVALISGEFESLDSKAIQMMLNEKRDSNQNISRCDDTDTSFNVVENINTANSDCDKGVSMEINESINKNFNTAFTAQSKSPAGSVTPASTVAISHYISVPDEGKIQQDSSSKSSVNCLTALKTNNSSQSIFPQHPTWVFTSIGELSGKRETVAKVEKLVTNIGGKLSRNLNFLTTHVIIEKVPDVKYRCIEFYEAIASKRVVLTIDWVNQSLERNTVLPLEPYLVACSSKKIQVQGQPHEAHSQPEECLFKNFQICFIGVFKCFTKGDLRRLVELCGGDYVSDPSLFMIGSQSTPIIVLETEKLNMMCPDSQFLRALKLAQRFSIVNINWLLDSITLGCIPQLCNYICDLSATTS